jgi:dTDP-4-dehydrorhamnose reductase
MAIILVTGSDGQLGNELKVISKNYYGYDFNFTDLPDLDICDASKTAGFIKKLRPEWIINCAAYNQVDKAESEPAKAMAVNADAVKNIADAIKGSECRFIHISSDYVFDGRSNAPYTENSIPAPLNAYGASKLAGEKAAMTHYSTLVIRTSWLYSSFGSNFAKTILEKAKSGGLLKVVFDQTGTPTYAADLAGAIMTIISGVIRNQFAFNTGIHHYSNEGVCSWYDFAEAIINESRLDCRVLPIRSGEYKTPAVRPVYSVLDKTRIKENYNLDIPHWRTSLRICIKLLM